MKLTVFCLCAVLLAVLVYDTTAAPRPEWEGWKHLERLGQNIYRAAEKTLPLIEKYFQLIKKLRRTKSEPEAAEAAMEMMNKMADDDKEAIANILDIDQ